MTWGETTPITRPIAFMPSAPTPRPETYEPTLVWETEWQVLADYDSERACEENRVLRVRRVGDLRRKIPEGSTRPEAKEVEELWNRITLARCVDRQHAR